MQEPVYVQEIKNVFPANITAAFSNSRINYDYRGGDSADVLKNRKMLFNYLDLNLDDAVFPQQVHKANIAVITAKDKSCGAFSFEQGVAETDALITNTSGIVLGMLSADCLPIILSESNGKAIGIVHAGWKGIAAGIIEKTIQAMFEQFKINPQNISVFFAPAIGSCCYEVGPEFKKIFPQDTVLRNNALFLDIKKAARKKCLKSGIMLKSVNDVSLCTRCSNERFFSYRGGDKQNRMLTLVSILNK